MISLVIFDLDGLMIDDESVELQFGKQAGKNLNYTISNKYYIEGIGRTNTECEKLFKLYANDGADFLAYKNECKRIEKEFLLNNKYEMKKGLMELISYLKTNHIKIAVGTSSNKEVAIKNLSDINVLEYIDYFVFGDEVTNSKPDPEIYLKVLQRANKKAQEALVLEDSKNGLLAATSAGIKCIVIPDICPIDSQARQKAYAILADLSYVIDEIIKINK